MTESTGWREHWPLVAAAVLYPAWVLYGSLFPLSGWRASGLSPFVFLNAALPRYWTVFDLVANLVLYLPLGFLWARVLALRVAAGRAGIAATIAAALLSLLVEIAQHWLPSRVPSNLDLACNTLGATAGALLAWRYRRAGWPAWSALWRQAAGPVRGSEAGVLLLVVWALIQLSPEPLLFCSGLARGGSAPWFAGVDPTRRLEIEALAVAAHTVAVGLIAASLMSGRRRDLIGRLVFAALLVVFAKAVVASFALGFAKAFDWLSAGSQWGAAAGAALLVPALLLPPRVRLAVALPGLAAGSVALLALPASPYAPPVAAELTQSPVRNFVGALDWLGLAWPPAAFAYVVWLLAGARRRDTGA